MSAPSFANVDSLRVFVLNDNKHRKEDRYGGNVEPTRLPVADLRFRILAAAACLAVDLLTSSQGYKSFYRMCLRILTAKEVDAAAIGRDPNLNRSYVNEFLAEINAEFPCIILNDLKKTNALTTRTPWEVGMNSHFCARTAGVIQVNSRVS